MTRDIFRTTETYTLALAPVIGPFFEALGALAHNLGEARTSLKAFSALSAYTPDEDDDE